MQDELDGVDDGGGNENSTPMATDGEALPIVIEQVEGDKDRKKRTKTAGADSPSTGSAASFGESVRSQ